MVECEACGNTIRGRNGAAYPQLPASPIWNMPSQGCFLPHIDNVLHLPFAHYESLNSQIQELQCGNFPARDKDINFKMSVALTRTHLQHFIKLLSLLSSSKISFQHLFGTYHVQHIILNEIIQDYIN